MTVSLRLLVLIDLWWLRCFFFSVRFFFVWLADWVLFGFFPASDSLILHSVIVCLKTDQKTVVDASQTA